MSHKFTPTLPDEIEFRQLPMASEASFQSGPVRIEALDTLRFIAAMIVVVGHGAAVLPEFSVPWAMKGLMNAKSAVALFFILSGYVLHLSFRSKALHWRPLTAFTIKRALRLYPLHFVALGLAAAAVSFFPLQESPALMGAEYTRESIASYDHSDIRQWLHQGSLISSGINTSFVNPPIWTLAVEMRISLIFPLIAFVIARLGLRSAGILTALSFLCAPWVASKTIASVGMIPLFCLGAFAAQLLGKMPTSQRSALWLLLPGLFVYSLAEWMGRQMLGNLGPFYMAGLGSALMIAAIIRHPSLASSMSHPLLVQLGQCSYGIYLLHFPLLLMLTCTMQRYGLSLQAMLPCLVAFTIALAWVLFRLVERPFMELGRKWSARVVPPGT
jgi:exopolysaccharide production protein ExoZ